MKDNGEFVLAPWYFADVQYPGIIYYREENCICVPESAGGGTVKRRQPTSLLLEHFEILETVDLYLGHLLVLRKTTPAAT